MLADYNFYKAEYKGIVFADANSYEYFGERASDELAFCSNFSIFREDEMAETQLKKCACRIADILNSKSKSGNIASESVSGYYSVSYAMITDKDINRQINAVIGKYLGGYIFKPKIVRW